MKKSNRPRKSQASRDLPFRVILAALIITAVTMSGCSMSSPSRPAPTAASGVTDLGIVELADHESRHYNLGAGRDCLVTLTSGSHGDVLVEAVISEKDAAGTTSIIAKPRILTQSGQQAAISIGDLQLALTPILKN